MIRERERERVGSVLLCALGLDRFVVIPAAAEHDVGHWQRARRALRLAARSADRVAAARRKLMDRRRSALDTRCHRRLRCARPCARESLTLKTNITLLQANCSACLMKNQHLATISAPPFLLLWLALLLVRSSVVALRFFGSAQD